MSGEIPQFCPPGIDPPPYGAWAAQQYAELYYRMHISRRTLLSRDDPNRVIAWELVKEDNDFLQRPPQGRENDIGRLTALPEKKFSPVVSQRSESEYAISDHVVIQRAIDLLKQDFKNLTSMKSKEIMGRLERIAGDSHASPQDRLLASKSWMAEWLKNRMGRARKPDILGILIEQNRIVFDLVEVGTIKTATSTFDELVSKMTQLQEIALRMDGELKTMQQIYSSTSLRSPRIPSYAAASASNFRIPFASYLQVIGVELVPGSTDSLITYICYAPSYRYRPNDFKNLDPGVAPGINGLVLYEIHQLRVKRVPDAVGAQLRKDWVTVHPSVATQAAIARLLPEPGFTAYGGRTVWDRQTVEYLKLVGEVGIVCMLAAFAWELGILAIAGSSELLSVSTIASTSTAVVSPSTITLSIEASVQFTKAVGPFASELATFLGVGSGLTLAR